MPPDSPRLLPLPWQRVPLLPQPLPEQPALDALWSPAKVCDILSVLLARRQHDHHGEILSQQPRPAPLEDTQEIPPGDPNRLRLQRPSDAVLREHRMPLHQMPEQHWDSLRGSSVVDQIVELLAIHPYSLEIGQNPDFRLHVAWRNRELRHISQQIVWVEYELPKAELGLRYADSPSGFACFHLPPSSQSLSSNRVIGPSPQQRTPAKFWPTDSAIKSPHQQDPDAPPTAAGARAAGARRRHSARAARP